jgi:hypothetical protein
MNGGSPVDAVLMQQVGGIVANANTNILNTFSISDTEIQGNLVVAILFRNTTNQARFIASVDTTAPTLTNRSFLGFATGLDESNLGSIPAGQFGSLESFNISGNFVIRAQGHAVPEPASLWVLGLAASFLVFIRVRNLPKHRIGLA